MKKTSSRSTTAEFIVGCIGVLTAVATTMATTKVLYPPALTSHWSPPVPGLAEGEDYSAAGCADCSLELVGIAETVRARVNVRIFY